MARYLTIGLLCLVLSIAPGCVRSFNLSANEVQETFLNGVDAKDVGVVHYCMRGNHAGLDGVARVDVSPEIAAKILKGAKDWGVQSPRTAEETLVGPPSAFNGAPPEWYQLNLDREVETFHRVIERETWFYYYDRLSGTLYLHYGHT